MLKLIYLIFITFAVCDDVYRYSQPSEKESQSLKGIQLNTLAQLESRIQCAASRTCSQLKNGTYGCCKYSSAVCCADEMHCCPEGTVCSLQSSSCLERKKPEVLLAERDVLSVPIKSVICPGGNSQCDDGQTCCLLYDDSYGCCPSDNAVCCTDKIHCCPQYTTCNLDTGSCDSNGKSVVLFQKSKNSSITSKSVRSNDNNSQCKDKSVDMSPSSKSVVCPDSQSQCNDGETCCLLNDGTYGCCPLPNAVCCSDKLHCCPQGSVCNVDAGTCDRQNEKTIQSIIKTKQVAGSITFVECPDGQSQCNTGHTCCLLSDGTYGCCPLPNAVCCSDKVHCCPHGTTCNPSDGTCDNQNGKLFVSFMKRKVPSFPIKSVVCPDAQSQCNDGETCCLLDGGIYGCCPFSNAVCCSDKLHCCPHGSVCNVAAGTCDRQNGKLFVSFMKLKVPSFPIKSVVCPDNQSQCGDGETCCLIADGSYACCPLPSAVCCSDKLHCCPHGTTCNPSAGTCDNQNGKLFVSFMKQKVPSFPIKSVVCPDAQSQCNDGETCCLLDGGIYGCCPFSNAVCCSDKLHCCPHGSVCNVAAGTCDRQNEKIFVSFMKQKVPSFPIKSVVCPDAQSQCNDGETCCLLADGSYGCCPFSNAVCCSDKLHCCPQGSVCNVAAGTCDRQNEKVFVSFMKLKVPSSPIKSVVCPDNQSQCGDGETCCLIADGSYACCPLPSAVCCSDKLHCCPHGTTCNPSAGTCDNQNGKLFVSFMKRKVPSFPIKSVVCPDAQSQCNDGETCCLLADGSYGCCPFSNAVCCSDKLHCCPQGSVCNVAAGTCDRQNEKIMQSTLKTKELAVSKASIMCPDHRSQCNTGHTCCLLSDGTYGCCPLPNAVCCSDKVHCCPHGTTCNMQAGTCDRQNKAQFAFIMRAKVPAAALTFVQCPDGKSKCADGQTCCPIANGEYGCCPSDNAVCCKDLVHCCPERTVCNLKSGKCDRALFQLQRLNLNSPIPRL